MSQVSETIKSQIGMMTILSVSGGRVLHSETGVVLPVSNGYRVRVEYDAGWDAYTVTREFKRGAKIFNKGSVSQVYCGELAEVVFRAGMFRSYEFGEVA